MAIVSQNIDRLNYLLSLFKLSKDELLRILNTESNKDIKEEDVFSGFVKSSVLNKVDKIFNKGLAYYANPNAPIKSSEESIFFRKDGFNASLNLRAKQIVNKFEEEKLNFDTLLKLTDTEIGRILPVFKVSDSPSKCANEIRKLIYPTEKTNTKGFLKNLISNLAAVNVLVFEFVENPNLKEKANINGFYSSPNVIVLKWQKFTKREIFTLAHEIGHYLLNEEDIDERVNPESLFENLSDIERWCNNFALEFLSGGYLQTIDKLTTATSNNDFHHDIISEISDNTHLSFLALYTHLLYIQKISKFDYKSIADNVQAGVKLQLEEEKRLLDIKKAQDELAGRKTTIPPVKPIISPLYSQTLRNALYSGIVNEYEFCRKLNINPSKIEDYLV